MFILVSRSQRWILFTRCTAFIAISKVTISCSTWKCDSSLTDILRRLFCQGNVKLADFGYTVQLTQERRKRDTTIGAISAFFDVFVNLILSSSLNFRYYGTALEGRLIIDNLRYAILGGAGGDHWRWVRLQGVKCFILVPARPNFDRIGWCVVIGNYGARNGRRRAAVHGHAALDSPQFLLVYEVTFS